MGTNTVLLELLKLLLNSVHSWKGARLSSIDLKNFYLDTPIPDPEYVQIKILDIPDDFIDKYKLTGQDQDEWIYFKICQGCYGLPKAGILANDLLGSHLEAKGFYEVASTPGLWYHKWQPIQFCLIANHFGVEYVGLEHFNYFLGVLKKFHGVQYNMAGDKFAGIYIEWDYSTRRCASVRGFCTRAPLIFFLAGNLNLQNSPKLNKNGQTINKERETSFCNTKNQSTCTPQLLQGNAMHYLNTVKLIAIKC